MLELRKYQQEAIDAIDAYVHARKDNPCVVIPTGGGKSLIMASIIAKWSKKFANFRCIVLAHRAELVEQNYEEFCGLDVINLDEVGIYAAGLGKRDCEKKIIFASIDSVYDKSSLFGHINCVIVDEAHRIPVRGDGKYRRFIKALSIVNPRLRVCGFTATPYRLDCGPVCHPDHLLNAICYEAHIDSLIKQGYLCPLRSKVSANAPDVSKVKRLGNKGDFVLHELAGVVNRDEVVTDAIDSALKHLEREKRDATIWFCVDVDHAQAVQAELALHGELAAVVTGSVSNKKRAAAIDAFRKGAVKHLCNCNCFTEGFNAKNVDSIVLLRPTMSKGLYIQMVGRGLRLHPSKTDCLVLDYARCIETHGPIDAPYDAKTRIAVCENCRNAFSWAVKVCPECGWEIPKQEVERVEREEAERKMHERQASMLSILGLSPSQFSVDEVRIARHRKVGSPDSLRVTYRCGVRTFNEWVCLDHEGYAREKAERWWRKRFAEQPVCSVDEVMADSNYYSQRLSAMTSTISVLLRDKYWTIIDHILKPE